MVRRTLVAGLGGMAGFVLWMFLFSPLITSLGRKDTGQTPRVPWLSSPLTQVGQEAGDRTRTGVGLYGLIARVLAWGDPIVYSVS
jgi:hypothetical protein